MNKILKRFKELIGGDQKNSIKEIKYFSPTEQKTMPNGSYYQRGGFIGECVKNSKSFITDNYEYLIDVNGNLTEAIHHTQYGLSDYRGGIIVFSTDVNSIEISKNRIINWAKQRLVSLKNRFFSKKILSRIISDYNLDDEKKLGDKEINDYIGAFSIGKFFSGRYFDDNGDVYDENSQTIEVNGISSEGLIFLAEEICKEFQQETVLVKDLNLNKIFLVNPYKSDDYNLSDINKKV